MATDVRTRPKIGTGDHRTDFRASSELCQMSALLGETPAEILELLDLDFVDHNDFARQVTAWAAAELRPRRATWSLP